MTEIITNSPLVFFVIMAVAAFVMKEFMRTPKKKRSNWKSKAQPQKKWNGSNKKDNKQIANAADQLKLVMKADFNSRALLNRPEAKVFKALDNAVIERNPNWQVMAQVSLGEFLSSPSRGAFFTVNSKRVDFALMDEKCCVIHALEYQGTGHHQGNAAARDAVKKEALRKAGIGYHEIVAGHTTPADLRQLVEKLVPTS